MSEVNCNDDYHNVPLNQARLISENARYQGTAGVSKGCAHENFQPAFLDMESGAIYLSRFADGRPAPFHNLDGLPEHVVVSRFTGGRVARANKALVSGFVRGGVFYTRGQAAKLVA